MSMSFGSGHAALDVVSRNSLLVAWLFNNLHSTQFGISHMLIQVRDRDTPAASVDT